MHVHMHMRTRVSMLARHHLDCSLITICTSIKSVLGVQTSAAAAVVLNPAGCVCLFTGGTLLDPWSTCSLQYCTV